MRKEATLKQWRKLYNIGMTLRGMTPWHEFEDMDIITIKLPGRHEPYFCSILGAGGQCFGISTFLGYEGLRNFLSIIDSENLLPMNYIMIEQENLACFFGDRETVPKNQRKIIKELGLKFRGKNKWIYFQSYKKGHTPYILDSEEADLLTSCLQELVNALNDCKESVIEIDFELGETLVRNVNKKTGLWQTKKDKLIPLVYGYPSLVLKDEILQAKMKKKPRVDASIEIDMTYIGLSIDDDNYDRPIRPKILLMVNHYDGMILGQHFLTPSSDEIEITINLFIDFIMEYGRPLEIFIRNPFIEGLLKDTCEKCGVKIIMSKDLEVVDAFMDGFEVLGF